MSRSALTFVLFLTATASTAAAQSPDAGVPSDAAPSTAAPSTAAPSTAAQDAATPAAQPGAPAQPPAQQRPTAIVLPNGQLLEVGCTIRVARRLEWTAYVVCDDGRLLFVDTREPYVEEVGMRGTAVGLFEHNGRLWVELVRHEALALDPHAPGEILPSTDPDPAEDRQAQTDPVPNPYAFDRARYPSDRELSPEARERVRERERERRERERPSRILGWEIAGHLRPFLSEGGVGAWLELSASYAFEAPLFVRAEIDPLGGAIGNTDSTGVFGAAAVLGLDHEYFQLGLGAGTQYVAVFERERHAEGLGLALLQVARIGMRDDTHVDVESAFVWVDGEMVFGGLEARMQVPLDDTMWFVMSGGGNIGGQYYGEVGLRIWLTPDREGSRGAYLIPTLGGASIDRDGHDSVAGPSISIGFELRP